MICMTAAYKNKQHVVIKDLTYYILKIGKPLSEATIIRQILKKNGIRTMAAFIRTDEELIFQFKGIGEQRKRTIQRVMKQARKDYRKFLWNRINTAQMNADISDRPSENV